MRRNRMFLPKQLSSKGVLDRRAFNYLKAMNKFFFFVTISLLLVLTEQARSQMVPDSLSTLPFAAVEVNYSINYMMYFERVTKLSSHRQYAQLQQGKLIGGITNGDTKKITYIDDTICFYAQYETMKLIIDTSQKIIKSLKYGYSFGRTYRGLSLRNISYSGRIDQPLLITLHDSLFDSCFQSYETGNSTTWEEKGASFHEATYSQFLNKDTANTITIRLYSPVALEVPSHEADKAENQLAFYPDPAKTSISINASSKYNGSPFYLYDLLGRVVLKDYYYPNHPISVQSLFPGTYLVSLNGMTRRLIIAR